MNVDNVVVETSVKSWLGKTSKAWITIKIDSKGEKKRKQNWLDLHESGNQFLGLLLRTHYNVKITQN